MLGITTVVVFVLFFVVPKPVLLRAVCLSLARCAALMDSNQPQMFAHPVMFVHSAGDQLS